MGLSTKTTRIFIVGIVIALLIGGSVGYLMAPTGVGVEEAREEGYQEGLKAGKYWKGVIKIGVPAPLTGALASEGEDFVAGAKWAAEEINEMGGIIGYKIELVTGDTEDFEAAKVTALMEKLINEDKVDAIMCGYGSQSLVELDVCNKYNMFYFYAADWMTWYDKWQEKKYPYGFNLVSSYTPYRWHFPQTMQEWIDEGTLELPAPDNKKVAIVYSDNYYSSWIAEGLREEFEKRGWTTTVWEMVPFGTVTEWGPILAKIRADPPALVINTDYIPSNEAAFVEQFLENPTKSHLFIQYAPWCPEYVELLGEKSDGTIFNSPNLDVYTSGNIWGEELLERAKKRLGREPGSYVYYVYNMFWIYKRGLEWAHAAWGAEPKDRDLIAKAIEERTAYIGESIVIFDEIHCASGEYAIPTLYQLWDGVRYTVAPEEYASLVVKPPPWWETA